MALVDPGAAGSARQSASVHSVTAFFSFRMHPIGYGIDRRGRSLRFGTVLGPCR